MRQAVMVKFLVVVLPLVVAALLTARPAAAQAMTFACKTTGGWEPQSRFDDFYAGRCDANGLLQGEGVAKGRNGYLRANFTDGLPAPGPALLSSEWKLFSPREQARFAPVCKLRFVSATELEGDIQCSAETLLTNKAFTRKWSLSSASGFQLEWTQGARRPDGQRLPAGNYLKASAVLVKADGPVVLKLARDLQDDHIRQYGGLLLATADLNLVSLFALVHGELPLENAKLELKSLDLNYVPYRNVTLTSIAGQFEIRFPYMEITASDNTRYRVTVDKQRLATGHPVDREMSFKYSNGYEVTIVSTAGDQSNFFYFKDNRDVEFSGLIPECLNARKPPGVLRFGDGWPARYLLTDTHTGGMSGPTRARGNQFVPSGCGVFKSGGNPEMRGEFKTQGNSGAVVFTPL